MAKGKKREDGVVVIADNSAERLIEQAIAANTPVDVMERLLAMRTQLRAEKAKEAFDKALAAFQAECPVIRKTKEVKSNGKLIYSYAPIESIIVQVRDALRNNDFSYSFEQELTAETVKVACVITHAQGHSQKTWMEVRLGTKTGVMSNSQQDAAASTFAKRYAFCNAFGILTGDEDTDGADFEQRGAKQPKVYTPVIEYSEPAEDTVQAQRETIFRILKARDVDVEDKEACVRYVADETQLALTEANFPEIIKVLLKR